MLSTVTAAQTLFRHDTATRARELAILRSMRDHQDALTASSAARAVRPRAVAWPRPIGVTLGTAATVCV